MRWLWFIAWHVLASLVTFAAFAIDKHRARRGGGRISERSLHFLEFAGGWPGAIAAMMLIRHKNRKARYWLVTSGIAIAHLGAWGWILTRNW